MLIGTCTGFNAVIQELLYSQSVSKLGFVRGASSTGGRRLAAVAPFSFPGHPMCYFLSGMIVVSDPVFTMGG
jgi:hypothetical protein